MTKNNHPFYCFKKNCRKTAWDTPEYLTNIDWANLRDVIKIIKKKDFNDFWSFVVLAPGSKDFFNRVLGWPEGWVYSQNVVYCEKTAIPMLFKDLSKMQKSIDNHKGKV